MNFVRVFFRLFLYLFIVLVGGFMVWDGVQEFDTAGTWINLVRGGFWMIIGLYAVAFGLKKLWEAWDE